MEEAFRRYRTDAQKAQEEAHEYIAKLKAEKEIQDEEIRTLKHELEKLSNEISRLSQRGGGAHHQGGGASNRMVELEEEAQLLKQQVSHVNRLQLSADSSTLTQTLSPKPLPNPTLNPL